MRTRCGQSGFTLMEILVTLAIILVLISALVGVGSYVKARANLDLTKALLETLSAALARYYDDVGGFPFDTATGYDIPPVDGKEDYCQTPHLEANLAGTVPPSTGFPYLGILKEKDGRDPSQWVSTASSTALFYFLDQYAPTREVVDGIAISLVTNKTAAGADIQLEKLPVGSGNLVDLPRYIDPWGMSIRYDYVPGTAFPLLTSAGPDRIFYTPDDITSK